MQFISKKTWLIGFVVAAIIGLAGWYFLSKKPASNQPPEYHDPLSGETVSDLGTTPEGPDTPVLLGLSKLLDYGLTGRQLESVKTGLTNFSKDHGVKEISLNVSTIKKLPRDPESDSATEELILDLRMNRHTDYKGRLVYELLGPIQLFLQSQDGKVSFDSGKIEAGSSSDSD